MEVCIIVTGVLFDINAKVKLYRNSMQNNTLQDMQKVEMKQKQRCKYPVSRTAVG